MKMRSHSWHYGEGDLAPATLSLVHLTHSLSEGCCRFTFNLKIWHRIKPRTRSNTRVSDMNSYFWRWGTWTCWHPLPRRCWPCRGRSRCRPPGRVWSAANRCWAAGCESHCSEGWAGTGGRPHLVQMGDTVNTETVRLSSYPVQSYVKTGHTWPPTCVCAFIRTCVCVYRLDNKACQIQRGL